MIMDTLAAIGLASEPPALVDHHNDPLGDDHEDGHNHNQNDISRRKEEKIIKEVMWRNVLVQAVYQLLVLIVMLYSLPYWFSNSAYNLVDTDFYGDDKDSEKMKQHYTILFNTFVMMTLAYQFTCRKLGWSDMKLHSHILNNRWFLYVLAGEFGIQYVIVEFPLFQGIFRTTSL
jgi:magnesium-transporting ATPase (P-type)